MNREEFLIELKKTIEKIESIHTELSDKIIVLTDDPWDGNDIDMALDWLGYSMDRLIKIIKRIEGD